MKCENERSWLLLFSLLVIPVVMPVDLNYAVSLWQNVLNQERKSSVLESKCCCGVRGRPRKRINKWCADQSLSSIELTCCNLMHRETIPITELTRKYKLSEESNVIQWRLFVDNCLPLNLCIPKEVRRNVSRGSWPYCIDVYQSTELFKLDVQTELSNCLIKPTGSESINDESREGRCSRKMEGMEMEEETRATTSGKETLVALSIFSFLLSFR